MLDRGVRRFQRLFGTLVAVVVRAGVRIVHADSADEGALAEVEGECGEEIGRRDVDGGVVGGCCGTVGEGAGDDAGVDGFGAGEGVRVRAG